jgi:hypothetical protein
LSVTSPAWAISPVIARRSVVLPDPFGPMIAVISPGRAAKSTPESTSARPSRTPMPRA